MKKSKKLKYWGWGYEETTLNKEEIKSLLKNYHQIVMIKQIMQIWEFNISNFCSDKRSTHTLIEKKKN